MRRDLSECHTPVSDFLRGAHPGPRFHLTRDQIECFDEHGYLAGIRVLGEAQVAQLRREFDAISEGEPPLDLLYEYHRNESPDPSTRLFHCLGQWRVSDGLHDVLWHPAVTVPASQLLHGAVRFWHDQLFYKPARHGGVVAWHQDYSYWTRTRPMAHLTCWIALDDATIENGCLHYVPGSHRWDLLPKPRLAGDMHAIDEVLSDAQRREFRPVAIELASGEASFHHPLMVHGSYENRTDRPRRGVVINVVRDGTCSYSDEPLLEGVPAIPAGTPLGGRFFPMLYDPSRPGGPPPPGLRRPAEAREGGSPAPQECRAKARRHR